MAPGQLSKRNNAPNPETLIIFSFHCNLAGPSCRLFEESFSGGKEFEIQSGSGMDR